MTKRVIAVLLWFYAGWYLGAELAAAFSVSSALGPIVGIAAAIFVVVDPGGFLWRTGSSARHSTKVPAKDGLIAAGQPKTE